jgi:hypothetical protein
MEMRELPAPRAAARMTGTFFVTLAVAFLASLVAPISFTPD